MTKQGYKFLIPAMIIALVLLAMWTVTSTLVFLPLAVLFAFLALFIAFFFRDPQREIPPGENLILSSADGKVIIVKPFDYLDFLGGKGTQISVFMSIFNVHINRAPVSGQVKFCEYNPGRFFPAFKEKASLENEQTTLGLESERGKIALKQIAGIIARRIVCRVKAGDRLEKGERFGLIQFGSRVDHFLPENVDVKVTPNQKVRAGETVIGVFRN
jgi:phosphatidylserine decarboxylase